MRMLTVGSILASYQDDFGLYYRVELEVDGLQKRERLRTLWIVRHGEDMPRLVSAYMA